MKPSTLLGLLACCAGAGGALVVVSDPGTNGAQVGRLLLVPPAVFAALFGFHLVSHPAGRALARLTFALMPAVWWHTWRYRSAVGRRDRASAAAHHHRDRTRALTREGQRLADRHR